MTFSLNFNVIYNTGVVKPSQVHVSCSNLSSKSLERWRQLGTHATDKNGLVVTKSDIIFICIKPHLMYQCAQQVEGNIEPSVCDSDKLFISVMTGATLDQLELVKYDSIKGRIRFQEEKNFFRLLVL